MHTNTNQHLICQIRLDHKITTGNCFQYKEHSDKNKDGKQKEEITGFSKE